MKKELKLQVVAKLDSVMTFHGEDYYITIQLPGWVLRYRIQSHEEEKIKKIFEDNQIQTIGELESKGII